MADNNIEWTSEQMIEKANSWSLAGDVALLNRLKKFSEFVLSETLSISENVDNLLNNLENVSLKLELTKNEFQSLRNTQFIENRVYEDDESLENEENKKEEKELTEQEKDNAIKESIVKGLKVMEQYFEKIEVAVSDSEEENEKSYVLQPKDPYANRPLPYLVGSQEWYKKWHVGLLLSESESESEKEEEVYSSSDSEEGLPKDRNLGSETSSELDFTNRQAPPVANSTFNDSQDRRREIFHSSDDDSSDQSHSLPVKPPISNEKFAEQLAAKLGDVISATSDNVPQVNRNPIKKMNQAGQYGNLFSDEPPPLDDLQDTVLPKSAHEGPFSGGRDLFGDSTEDNLFWDQPNKTSQIVKNREGKTALFGHADVKPNLKVSKGLFDDSDSSSEDDMFTKVEKRKTKITQPYLQPFKTTLPFLDDQPPEISKSDTVPSKKKPIGGVSIFGENSNIFSDNSLKPGFESDKTAASTQITEDIESKPAKTPKRSKQKISLFDESSDEDLKMPKEINVTKSPERQQTVKKLSLFDDTDDILGSENEPIKKPEHDKKNIGLFDENPYQNVDSFRPTTKEITDKTESLNKTGDVESEKPAKKVSLFDEDDDFLKEEEDIFASVPKKKGTFSDSSVKPEKTRDTNPQKKIKGLFDDLETEDSSETLSGSSDRKDNIKKIYEDSERSSEEKPAKGLTKTLFDDLETSGSSEDLFGGSKTRDTKQKEGYNKKDLTGNLFGDTESFTGRTNLLEEPKMDGMNVKSVEKVVNLLGDEKEKKEQPLEDKNSGGSVQGSIFDKTDNDYFEDSSIKSTDSSDILKIIDLKDDDLIVRTNQEVEKDVLGNFKAARAIDDVKNQEDGVANSSKKHISDQPDDILKQNKSNLVGKIRKNVSFLDSGSESSSDDDFSFGKKNKEEKQEDSVLHGTRTTVNVSDDFMKSTVSKHEELNISGLERQEDVNNTERSRKISTEKLGNSMNASPPELDETPDSNVSKVFATLPPIDLFDPNPPPLDWDAASDNSGESDTLSLTDGILSRTNLNQSQTRSSLFDEAPPSLDANDSSGIVRDLNVTRVESIDSSFNPHASSSRRLSSDVFGEEQSQDSLFITKNQTENSAQHLSRLQQIPENVERSSKIENITPSGNWEDFKDSSVFTTSEIESGDSRNMEAPTSASEIKKTGESPLPEDKAEDIQSVDISSHKILDNVKNRANLFEESRGLDREKSVEKDETNAKSRTSPIKTSPGKLQHNLKINVGALLPGAARPKILVAKSTISDEIDKSDRFSPPVGEANSSPPVISRVTLSKSENINNLNKEEAIADNKNFENLSQTEVLQSATKDRVRIPIKRKPSTRRARQEAVRKSMTDFTLYQNEENPSLEYEQSLENKISQSLTGINVQSENGNRSRGPGSNERNVSVKRSEEKPEIKGISFRKQEETTEKAKSPDSADLFGSLAGDITYTKLPSPEILKTEDKTKLFGSPSADLQPSQILQSEITTPSPPKTLEKKDREPEAKSIFEDSFEDNLDLFKNTSKFGDSSGKPRNDKSLFGDEGSNSSDEDLFSSTKKAFKKDLILSTDKPLKVEDFSSRKDTKRVFSDSEGDGELFGDQSKVSAAKTGRKIIGENSKKASIFNDSDDSSEEDLFGSKTSKSGDFSRETVSIIGSKPVETKNVRIAGIKKLENKEVTDSDPLSALK